LVTGIEYLDEGINDAGTVPIVYCKLCEYHFIDVMAKNRLLLVTGLEYLEEGMNDAGTAPSFYCKLCECHFTDVMAKIMHTKGRRHRLQYKKKVDPTLRVEMKVTPFDRRLHFRRNIPIPETLAWRKREMQATYKWVLCISISISIY